MRHNLRHNRNMLSNLHNPTTSMRTSNLSMANRMLNLPVVKDCLMDSCRWPEVYRVYVGGDRSIDWVSFTTSMT